MNEARLNRGSEARVSLGSARIECNRGSSTLDRRLRVLTLSELFPNPAEPIFGIFVERQVSQLKTYCDITVVSPVRVFPHLQLWRTALHPMKFMRGVKDWFSRLSVIPSQMSREGVPVLYPRYSSPPRQLVHGSWGYFCYAFLRRTLKVLQRRQNFDLIHAHCASPCGLVALLSKRWMGVPVVVSVHGEDLTYTARQNRLSAAVVRRVLRDADMVIGYSSWTGHEIRRLGVSASRIRVLPLGGDPAGIVNRGQTSASVPILLSVGYLFEMKGHKYVLHAIRRLMDLGYQVRYIVVGDGPERGRLETLSQSLGLQGVVSFIGAKKHEDVWAFYQACDIFVLPSVVEGFGVAFIEALTMGKPIVGCEGTGAPDDVNALGHCVELVKPRDVDSLVHALKGLLDDPERRREMGRIGRDIAHRHFTWARSAEATFNVYAELCASQPQPSGGVG